jgi:hypothetical protein
VRNAEGSAACILNAGAGAWAFDEHAERLSQALWLDVSDQPADHAYLLGWDEPGAPPSRLFIPFEAIGIAADKRLQARAFQRAGVRTPETVLLEGSTEVREHVLRHPEREWVVKWPIGCGGAGHRILNPGEPPPEDWPRPYVLQEFVRMDRPEVYRVYCVGGELFGWNVRRYADGAPASPWVAHARGAGYAEAGPLPPDAECQAMTALAAVDLLASFGCVDLLRAPNEGWLVLEVGTDGVYNHVDRMLELPHLEREIDRRIAEAFWAASAGKPWGEGGWRPHDD